MQSCITLGVRAKTITEITIKQSLNQKYSQRCFIILAHGLGWCHNPKLHFQSYWQPRIITEVKQNRLSHNAGFMLHFSCIVG